LRLTNRLRQLACKGFTPSGIIRYLSIPSPMLGAHSTYKKLAVQWLNEALCFVSSFVMADCFVLRNRQLLVAAKR